jgi:endonuclease/exonuclease/phosphatase family metal-dependent hydrolase
MCWYHDILAGDMLKLATLNMEGVRHYDRIIPFITTERPDCLCLQEMPAAFLHTLFTLGYFVQFAPMSHHSSVAPGDTLGIGLATLQPYNTTTRYYMSKASTPLAHNKHDAHSKSYPVITCTINNGDGTYIISTTHLYDTWDGLANPNQTECIESLISYTKTLPPHILCGDFNMPRGYNTNYELFCQQYTDTIPAHYTSSLDRTLHRAGNRTDLNAPIFDIYMVDYIFAQPSYQVDNVKLHFGVSDHAAVTADVIKTA